MERERGGCSILTRGTAGASSQPSAEGPDAVTAIRGVVPSAVPTAEKEPGKRVDTQGGDRWRMEGRSEKSWMAYARGGDKPARAWRN